jgi:hypothetical protein
MIKKILVALLATIIVLNANAQQAFRKGDACLNIGIGLGSPYHYGYSVAPLPSFNAAFEYGIYEIKNIGVITAGGFGDIRHTWYKYDAGGKSYKDTWTTTTFAARAAFHLAFLKTEKFDVYGGLMTGIRHEVYKNENGIADYSDNYFTTDAFVGGKIMFKKNIGAFAEAGYGVSFLKIGFTFMF